MASRFSLAVVLLLALFVRLYRVGDLLGFYYDEGRDAKVIWNLIYNKDFFLIGPTTGIEGIFLGPFYYYLITPFYLFGGGHPVWPAVALILMNVLAIYIVYKIGKKYFSAFTGLMAAFLLAISYKLMLASRWLSNPTPLPLSAAMAVWSLLEIAHGQKQIKWWIVLGLSLGLSLHFEAASAIFFLPAVAIILSWQKIKPHWTGLIAFFLTLMPQIVFDFRNEHILSKAFYRFLINEKSFQPVFSSFTNRLLFYKEVLTDKFVFDQWLVPILAVLIAIMFRKKIFNKTFTVLIIWCVTPFAILLFYYGNNGYIWDYYFIGIYPFVLLLVAIILAQRKVIALLVMLLVFWQNAPRVKSYLMHERGIALKTSLAAVDWVYKDALDKNFNVDVYVPPVIPHAYDYLFLWRGKTKWQYQPSLEQQSLLYTLYEQDPYHPQFLQSWQVRQDGIAKIESQVMFGDIGVQKRWRK